MCIEVREIVRIVRVRVDHRAVAVADDRSLRTTDIGGPDGDVASHERLTDPIAAINPAVIHHNRAGINLHRAGGLWQSPGTVETLFVGV